MNCTKLICRVPILPRHIWLTRAFGTFFPKCIKKFWSGSIGTVWLQKSHKRKISKIHKGFELYIVFMHIFHYQNVSIFLLYAFFTRRIDTFWSEGIYTKMPRYYHWTYCLEEESTRFGLEVSKQSGIENHKPKISDISQKSFELCQFFMKKVSIPNCPKTQTTCYLTNPFLCHYLPKLFISNLAYNTHIILILRSNLNFKKLLECYITAFHH